jgi:hypothetical protein
MMATSAPDTPKFGRSERYEESLGPVVPLNAGTATRLYSSIAAFQILRSRPG